MEIAKTELELEIDAFIKEQQDIIFQGVSKEQRKIVERISRKAIKVYTDKIAELERNNE